MPTAAVTATVLVLAVARGILTLCRGLALLLSQNSADRRELALREAELDHHRWQARHRGGESVVDLERPEATRRRNSAAE